MSLVVVCLEKQATTLQVSIKAVLMNGGTSIMKKNFNFKTLAIGFLTLATIGLTSWGSYQLSSATNQTVQAATTDTDSVSSIGDDTSTRAITIHKYAGSVEEATGKNAKATGTTADAPTGNQTPLANVGFSAQKVTAVNGASRSTIKPTDSATYTTIGDPISGTTNTNGVVNLDLGTGTAADGLYLITEATSTSIKTATTPFLVQVPQSVAGSTVGKNGSLLYDVNVYPKNSVVNTDLNPVEGFASDTTANAKVTTTTSVMSGGQVVYNWVINTPADLATATNFVFSDLIDQNYSKIVSVSNITGYYVKADGSIGTLDIGNNDAKKDFLTFDNTSNSSEPLTVTFTPQGIAKAAGSQQIIIRVPAKVTMPSAAVMQATNKFTISYTNALNITKTAESTSNPTTVFGNINLKKIAASDKSPLAGATFKLADSIAHAKAGQWIKDYSSNYAQDDLAVTSDANGNVQFFGLQVDPTSKTKDYYAVETNAPAGYDRDNKIYKVTAAQDTTVDATIADESSSDILPNFPLSGSKMNLYIMMLAALLVVIAGTLLIIYSNRKRHNDHGSMNK